MEEPNNPWFNTLAGVADIPVPYETPARYPPQSIWHCPSAYLPEGWDTQSDYGYNCYGMSPVTDTNSIGLGGHHICISSAQQPAPAVNESEVVSPSERMAIGDGFKGGNDVILDGSPYLWRTYGVLEEQSLSHTTLGSTKRSYSRHRGKANVVFCDGHVESPKA